MYYIYIDGILRSTMPFVGQTEGKKDVFDNYYL